MTTRINYAFSGFVDEGDRLRVTERAEEVPGRFLSYVLFLHAALNRDKLNLGTPEQFLASGEPFYYVQEFTGEYPKLLASYNGGPPVISQTISAPILDAVRRGSATLLFSLSQEGYELVLGSNVGKYYFFDFIQNFAAANALPPTKVWFIHGNLRSHVEYTSWLGMRDIPPDGAIRFFPVCSMMTSLARLYELHRTGRDVKLTMDSGVHPITTTIQWTGLEAPFEAKYTSVAECESELETDSVRSHKFLCFNNALRPHRRTVVALLHALHMLPSGLVSMNGGWGPNGSFDSISDPSLTASLKRAWGELESRLPLAVDVGKESKTHEFGGSTMSASLAFSYASAEPYRASYVNFVTETLFLDDRTLFITEKVFKPILFLQPFVIFGSPRTLRYLRRLGFKTFSRVLDESYDEECDPERRMMLLMQIVDRIRSMSLAQLRDLYRTVLPEVVHNFHHLFAVPDPLIELLNNRPIVL